MEDKFFRYAIIVSCAIHLGFFAHFYITHRNFEFWKKPQPVMYNLVKPKPRVDPKTADRRDDRDATHMMEKLDEPLPPPAPMKAVSAQEPRSEAFPKDLPGMMDKADIFERKPEKLKGVKVTKEVSVPMLKSERINTPSYVSYYQIVRDRIRERAYSNYTKLSVGEVFVTFIIKSDGSLSGLQVLDTKSAANDFLRHVGIKSVQEAAPFPVFPKDLVYPELTFNVSISFQYREE